MARNSPRQTVLSGHREALEEVYGRLVAAGVQVRPLAVDRAFHAPPIEPACREQPLSADFNVAEATTGSQLYNLTLMMPVTRP